MANIEQVQNAFMKAHAAGDAENAQLLATHLKSLMGQNAPIDPTVDSTPETVDGVQQYPESATIGANQTPLDVPTSANLAIQPEADPEYTTGEKAYGALETAKTVATGATTGLLGRIGGTAKGLIDEVQNMLKGGTWNADNVQRAAEKLQADLTDTPDTKAGQEYTQAVGDALKPLEAINPAQGMVLGSMARNTATVAKAGVKAKGVSEGQTAVNNAERSGIDLMTSDVKQPTTFLGKNAQAIGEKIPIVGTGSNRAKQQNQRIDAVNDLFDQYGAGDIARASDDVARSLLKKHGADIKKYSGQKNEVIDRLSFNTMDNSKITKALDESIGDLSNLDLPSSTKGIISKLEEYKTAFADRDLNTTEILRKQLGEELKDPSLTAVKSTADKTMAKVYKAVNESMGDHIKKHGERRDFNKWQIANKRLATNMVTQKKTALKSIIDKGEVTPEKVKQFLFSQKPSEIKLLYKGLTPEGKKSAKIAIMQEAMERLDRVGSIAENMSPDRFISQMAKLSKSTDIIFNGAEKAQLKGLVDTLNITRQASKAGVNNSTGGQLLPFAAPAMFGALSGGSIAVTAGGTATIGLLAKAWESKAVRNSMIKVGQAKSEGAKQLAYQSYLKAISNPELGLVAIQNQELKK